MSRAKTLILHGWGGSDIPHWQAWLACKLASNYGTVSFPMLDNPHFPSKNRWVSQTKELLAKFKPDTVICHSLGCILWFWLANEEISDIKHLILVAPPSIDTKIDTIKSFFPCPLPLSLHASKIDLIVSDNDVYMSIDEAKEIAKKYDIQLEILHQAGHINSDSGFGEWEYILKLVTKQDNK
ncbi:MAG: alpha/beta hydrolase [Sulfurovaceae bacterium]|nr:alpha/beta hydrolase [Sulfurovaceae bacterium]